MEKFPIEILTEIFLRMPAKPIGRMRCVSKPWNALLSKPSFIKSHLNRSTHNHQEILVLFSWGVLTEKTLFTAHPTKFPHLEPSDLIKPPFNSPSGHLPGIVIGSVNGLICYTTDSSCDIIHIWNPSLTALLTLPPCSLPTPCIDPDGSPSEGFAVSLSFGFDPETDDYKVVKLVSGLMVNFFNSSQYIEWVEVEVYSMRKGSWEVIPHRFPSQVTKICSFIDEVCVDGHHGYLHWLCYVDYKCSLQMIVAFDLGSHTFSEIPLPDSIKHDKERSNSLGFLAGKLCVISLVLMCYLEVWVLEEYGVAQSWVKKRNVIPQFDDMSFKPLGFTLTGELLFDVRKSTKSYSFTAAEMGHLALCHRNTNKVKCFKTMARARWIHGTNKVVPYVDSLVWVAPSKSEIASSSSEKKL